MIEFTDVYEHRRRRKRTGLERDLHIRLQEQDREYLRALCAYFDEPYSVVVTKLIRDNIVTIIRDPKTKEEIKAEIASRTPEALGELHP